MKTIERLFRESNRIKKAMVAKVRGQWIPLEKEIGLYECSICGHKILRSECNYCPNCGSRMDLDEVKEPRYCDRNVCASNEVNGIGCDECPVMMDEVEDDRS